MPDSNDISDAIATNATGPKSVPIDGNNATQHSIAEQTEAANHAASKAASTANRPGMGVRVQKITPYYT